MIGCTELVLLCPRVSIEARGMANEMGGSKKMFVAIGVHGSRFVTLGRGQVRCGEVFLCVARCVAMCCWGLDGTRIRRMRRPISSNTPDSPSKKASPSPQFRYRTISAGRTGLAGKAPYGGPSPAKRPSVAGSCVATASSAGSVGCVCVSVHVWCVFVCLCCVCVCVCVCAACMVCGVHVVCSAAGHECVRRRGPSHPPSLHSTNQEGVVDRYGTYGLCTGLVSGHILGLVFRWFARSTMTCLHASPPAPPSPGTAR